jgi:branched-chain amino acid transport system ATP-binding protein
MLLELRNVDGKYSEIHAVRNLSLALEEGRSLGLLGRNGSGKSTALKLIAGVLPNPARGEIIWKGTTINGLPPEDRVRCGVVLVPEGRGIFPALSVESNVNLGAYWRRPNRKQLREQQERVYELLPRLSDLRRRMAGSLSGGEQQMLAVGRALMSDPEVLLLDEPSLGLAPKVVDALYDILRRLTAERISIVLVEQYVGLAVELCDEIIGLDKGEIVLSGNAEAVGGSAALERMYMASGLQAATA